MSFWIPLALGAAGLAKGIAEQGDVRQEKLLQAEIARHSPWTGIQPRAVQGSDPLGQALQGGTAGLGLGQAMDASSAANELQAQQMKLAERSQENDDKLTEAQLQYYQQMGLPPPQQVMGPKQPQKNTMMS